MLFDASVGDDPRDPNCSPPMYRGGSGPPGQSSATLIGGSEGRGALSLQGLKLGVPAESFVVPLDPEVHATWQAALLVLKEEGAEVLDVNVQRPTMQMYRTIQMPEASRKLFRPADTKCRDESLVAGRKKRRAHMQKGWLRSREPLRE